MSQTQQFILHDHAHKIRCVLFAAAFAIPFLSGLANSGMAQEKLTPAQEILTPAQEQNVAKCLVSCKKGDASCQNSCTNKTASPAYFSAAGSCVRACADALALSGQDQSHVGDLVHCVRACN